MSGLPKWMAGTRRLRVIVEQEINDVYVVDAETGDRIQGVVSLKIDFEARGNLATIEIQTSDIVEVNSVVPDAAIQTREIAMQAADKMMQEYAADLDYLKERIER